MGIIEHNQHGKSNTIAKILQKKLNNVVAINQHNGYKMTTTGGGGGGGGGGVGCDVASKVE